VQNINQRRWLTYAAVILLSLAALIFANYQFAKTSPGGTDFLVHWEGTRNFFTTGTSPYSDDTALKIQTMVYGRAAEAGEHELRVAYPLYSLFFFAPFALIKDFTLARAVWMAILENLSGADRHFELSPDLLEAQPAFVCASGVVYPFLVPRHPPADQRQRGDRGHSAFAGQSFDDPRWQR